MIVQKYQSGGFNIFKDLSDEKLLRNIDSGIIASTLLLVCTGILMIYSATSGMAEGPLGYVAIQSVAFVLGAVTIIFVLAVDYRRFYDYYKIIYGANILLLISVLILGVSTHGARSWFDLGFVRFQPSEIVKIGIVLTFARYLEMKKEVLNTSEGLGKALVHIGVPIGLILLQPDFGTAVVYVIICTCMIIAAGLNTKIILGGLSVFMVSIPVAWFLFLQDYQKKRIKVFFDPSLDRTGAGYNVYESKLAIGSGQFWGKGIFHGTLHTNGFVPERHTDFIFSVIGEELGFVGAALVILLFLWLVLRCIHVAKVSKDDYGMFVCVGIMAMLLFHIFQNIGMTIGVMPVTGIPLPFISYGGSALLTNMIAVGIVLNVGMRRSPIRF